MKYAFAAWGLLIALAAAPARGDEAGCGENLRLSVDPPAKAADVAAVLRRRLAAAGVEAPMVETDGAGLRAVLPAGAHDSLFTRPARIEFRLVAKSADAPGALALPRLDGAGVESVEPEIILDEGRLRDLKVKLAPNPAGGAPLVAVAFRLEPTGAKNLMAATAEGIGRKLAIIVDNRILADPIIRAPVASIVGEISGGFTPESAAELVQLTQSGRLGADVAVVSRAPAGCMTH